MRDLTLRLENGRPWSVVLLLSTLLGGLACSEPPAPSEGDDAGLPTARAKDGAAAAQDSGSDAGGPTKSSRSDAGVERGSDESGASTRPRPDAPALCFRPGDDAVRDVFCGAAAPTIASLRDLQERLGMSFAAVESKARDELEAELREFTLIDSLVALGHSTALSGHLVSPINPRALILGRDSFIAFQRGVQKVELISLDRGDHLPNFYLLEFKQACNAAPRGCVPGDLYTPNVEREWLAISLRDDEDLKNEPEDCRQCHQRGLDQPQLLIREINGNWLHFFALDPVDAPPDPGPFESGRELVQDFLRAKGDEPYGNIPSYMFRQTAGGVLQNLATDIQPLLFHSDRIEDERFPFGPSGYSPTPQRSASWDAAYEKFKRGEQLALPHYLGRPTDPQKQARLTEAYIRYRNGQLAAEDLPDLGDIFPDDPRVRAEIGLQTEPGAAPADVLIQACGSCHNDVLDQSVSRARFSIALARMHRGERELAIARVELGHREPGVMPPPESRQLDPEAKRRLIEYLRADTRPAADDARLEHAAEQGMRWGGRI